MKLMIKVLSEKVDNACAALSIEARNVNKDEEYEQFIEDDNGLATAVYECVSGLERRRKELFLSRGKSAGPALEEQVVHLQTQLDQLMLERQ